MLGIAYGMTLQLVVIVDNYSPFVSKEASLSREDRQDKQLVAQFKLEVQYDPSTYCGCAYSVISKASIRRIGRRAGVAAFKTNRLLN